MFLNSYLPPSLNILTKVASHQWKHKPFYLNQEFVSIYQMSLKSMFLIYLVFSQNLADIPTSNYNISMKCCEGVLNFLNKVRFSFISNVAWLKKEINKVQCVTMMKGALVKMFKMLIGIQIWYCYKQGCNILVQKDTV